MEGAKMTADTRNRKQRRDLARQLQAANPGLDVVHPRAAGIDIGNGTHYVAVRPDQDPEPVRRFECFTADLHRLADWLEACGVETIAMQSTGVYWIPLYEILEERGLEVYLVNARHTKNLPGRKSDVQESQRLHIAPLGHGRLLRGRSAGGPGASGRRNHAGVGAGVKLLSDVLSGSRFEASRCPRNSLSELAGASSHHRQVRAAEN